MSLERMPGPTGAEPGPIGIADGTAGSPLALRLQVLSTEHWGLLATRSLAWNESFTRAGMYLTTLTGSIVALALIAQVTDFGDGFVLFALVILPVVLFLGLTTYLRMGTSNYYDALCVVGMNRIRHAYLEITPEVEPYLVMGAYDDEEGVNLSMGQPPNANFAVYLLASTPFVLATINSVLAGVIALLVALQLGTPTGVTAAITVVGTVLIFALQILIATRDIAAAVATFRPMFPRPAPAPAAETADEG